jgi:hypothetical protein
VLATISAVIGGLTMTALADTNSTNTNDATNSVTQDTTNAQYAANKQMMEQGFGGRGHSARMELVGNGMYGIEVSSEYTANVNSILGNDTDVASLIQQGYNVTSINPIVKNIIEGDGTIATKANTAIVTMQNGISGYATVNVDVTNAKVTQITLITRTVIDKSSS